MRRFLLIALMIPLLVAVTAMSMGCAVALARAPEKPGTFPAAGEMVDLQPLSGLVYDAGSNPYYHTLLSLEYFDSNCHMVNQDFSIRVFLKTDPPVMDIGQGIGFSQKVTHYAILLPLHEYVVGADPWEMPYPDELRGGTFIYPDTDTAKWEPDGVKDKACGDGTMYTLSWYDCPPGRYDLWTPTGEYSLKVAP